MAAIVVAPHCPPRYGRPVRRLVAVPAYAPPPVRLPRPPVAPPARTTPTVSPTRGRTRPLAPAVYRRRRAVAALVGVTVLVGLYLAVGALVGAVSAAPAATTAPSRAAGAADLPASYTVRPGDTLWSIARRVQPDGDLRPLVDALAERNGGSALQAGQRLDLSGLVPAPDGASATPALASGSTGGAPDATRR